jgi:uncharacterized protein YbjT (DUF2867 family)
LNDKNGGYRVRALTRNPDSDKAKELSKLGAEVVAADVDDEKSLEKAFRGAHGAFCVTFFWEHLSPEKEFAHASAMARAAKSAGVKHVIWSTLEDTRKWVPLSDDRMPTLMGKYKVPHFDAKGEADKVFTDLGPRGDRTKNWRSRFPWGTGSCRGSPPTTSASARTASSRRDQSSSERPSGSPAST